MNAKRWVRPLAGTTLCLVAPAIARGGGFPEVPAFFSQDAAAETSTAGGADSQQARTTEAAEVTKGQDPTTPVNRFDLRLQYLDLPGGSEAWTLTPRLDQEYHLNEQWYIGTRFDLPLPYANTPSGDNPNGNWEGGVGDFLSQAYLANQFSEEHAWAVGARLTFPTATEDQFGTGKLVASPLAAYRVFLPRISKGSFFAMLARYDCSVAGDGDRASVSQLALGPITNFNLPDDWFVTLWGNADITYDFISKEWFVPIDVTVGKLISKKYIVSLEVEVPVVDNLDLYDFRVELRVGFFF